MAVKQRQWVRPDIFFFPQSDDSRPYLLGSSCPSCKSVHFPPKGSCPSCFATEIERVALSRRGTVYSYAIVRQAQPGFQTPYILAYVDLPEGIRLLTQLTGVSEHELRIGMEAELVLEPVRHDGDGTEVIGFKFRPLPAYAESHGRPAFVAEATSAKGAQPVDECEKRGPSEALAKEGMLRRVTPKHG